MDFVLPPDIEEVRLRIRRFVDEKLIPLEADRANYDEHENIAPHVLAEMRKDEKLRTLPVVILSSSREEADLVRSWGLGVNAYVVKPVDVDQFFDAVRTLGRFWAVLNEPLEAN